MTTKTSIAFAAWVGIDWADRKHDICLQAGAEAKREFVVLEHRPEAIEEWANALREPASKCTFRDPGGVLRLLAL